MNRKSFLKKSLFVGGLVSLSPQLLLAQDKAPMDSKLVNKFVGAAHGKMDVVKTMLEEHPNLINVAWDWGSGDFETGLGAASHVGHKELARYLIDNGAQPNIFTACLFGQLDIVKALLTAFPSSLNALGPHGFTLLHHANRGGEDSVAVKEYLTSLGAKETKIKIK